jgi:hypothetical protein
VTGDRVPLVMTRADGSDPVARTVIARQGNATCLECAFGSRHVMALAKGVEHARQTGHTVQGAYQAIYTYGPVAADG